MPRRTGRGRRQGPAVLVVMVLLGGPLAPREARAQPSPTAFPSTLPAAGRANPDPWFGRDKLLHAVGSFGLSSGGYAVGVATLDRRWAALLFGGGVSLALGGLKEGLDAAGLGQPSARDFVWDVVGTALGLGVSITFDAALRGPQPGPSR